MATVQQDRTLPLREKIEQQRRTVESLRRSGHECPDAERQLDQMLAKLKAAETPFRARWPT